MLFNGTRPWVCAAEPPFHNSAARSHCHVDRLGSLQMVGFDGQKTIGVYPIDDDSWTDIGQWTEYRKALTQL